MRTAFYSLRHLEFTDLLRKRLLRLLVLALFVLTSKAQAADDFESRTWTDRLGNQLTGTFVDAKNGEAQLKNGEGKIVKFKLADFSEPDQKYLRDLANYRRKLAAGEKVELPADPAKASLVIQPRQENTEPQPNAPGFRKPLLDFPIRIWTDTTGKKIQGKLVTAYNDKVVIDVKGSMFDLQVTRLSGDDQQYISIQLKGLQRDDLVADLAKATAVAKQPDGTPAGTPAPAAVAANTPAPAPANAGQDDIQARLAQLKSQLQGNNPNPAPETQTVPNNPPPAQPAETNDINARLAELRKQAGVPDPGPTPEPSAAWNAQANDSPSPAQAAVDPQPEEMNPSAQEKVAASKPSKDSSSTSSSESDSGSGGSPKSDISFGYFMAFGAAIAGGLARFLVGGR